MQAASGIKLACPDLNDIQAGMPIISVKKGASSKVIEKYTQELLEQNSEMNIKTQKEGLPYFYYILFTADVFEIVKEKFGEEDINFSEYGIILHEGKGEPDENTEKSVFEKLAKLKK